MRKDGFEIIAMNDKELINAKRDYNNNLSLGKMNFISNLEKLQDILAAAQNERAENYYKVQYLVELAYYSRFTAYAQDSTSSIIPSLFTTNSVNSLWYNYTYV